MIGIGITTTPNRKDIFEQSYKEWKKYRPSGSLLFVCLDEAYSGVASSKNRLLRELYYEGCDHFFLADDDCVPLKKDWWRPYVEHPEPHLMYQFKLPSKPHIDMQELYRDEQTVAYTHTRGAMIYIDRIVLDTVGGMDTRYGKGGFEHPDWTNRIHNAGLTTHRAMDVPNSYELFYCLDQDGLVKSSRRAISDLSKSVRLYRQSKKSKEYKEFR